MTSRRSSTLVLISAICSSVAGCNAILGNDVPEHAATSSAGAAGAGTGGSVAAGGMSGSSGQSGGAAGASGSGDQGGVSGTSGHLGGHGGISAGGGIGVGAGGKKGGEGGGGSGGTTAGAAGQGGSVGGVGGESGGIGGSTAGAAGMSGGGEGGASGTAGTAGAAGSGGSIDCPVVFVSPSGDDAMDGCSPGAARQTIAQGVARAQDFSADKLVRELHVCAGTYDVKGYDVHFGVSIGGGYACDTWLRSPSFGFPDFDPTAATHFVTSDVSALADTFSLSGMIGAGAVIDGIWFDGAAPATVSSMEAPAALSILGGSPTVRDCVITGGALTNNLGIGSAGILVSGKGTSPSITRNKIGGGSGTSTNAMSPGSVGVSVRLESTPEVVGNVIDGGSGHSTNGNGSIGLYAFSSGELTGPSAISGNTIHGGSGLGAIGNTGALLQTVPTAEFSDNDVDGGTQPSGSPGGGRITALAINGGGMAGTPGAPITILRNRIYGGDSMDSRAHHGLQINGGATQVIVVNNEIHSGGSNGSSLGDIASSAILCDASVGFVKITHNTVMVPPSTATWPLVKLLGGGASAMVTTNNVFLGSGASSVGMSIVSCNSDGTLAVFNANAFVNVGGFLANDGCASGSFSTVQSMEGATGLKSHFASIMSANNLVVRAVTDVADASSIGVMGCDTPSACATKLFPNWSAGDFGEAGMFVDVGTKRSGIAPAASAPCSILQSKDHDGDVVTADLSKSPRMMAPTMGAFEVNSTSCCVGAGSGCGTGTACCSGVCSPTMKCQ